MAERPASLVFDFDSTLVTLESLDELADIALQGRPGREDLVEALRHITAQGMAGELTFDASLHERLGLFTATHQHLASLDERLADHLSPSAVRNIDWFNSNAERCYVVSGGFKDFILPVTKRLGIPDDHVYANEFTWHDGAVSGFKTDNLLCQPQGKAHQLAALNLPRPIVMVGDGYTDYEPRQSGAADAFWCYTETSRRDAALKFADEICADFDAVIRLSL